MVIGTLQIYTGIWEDVEDFTSKEEAFKRIDELKATEGYNKFRNRICLDEDILRTLSAKERKSYEIPKDAVFIGSIMRPYGDEYYYRLQDGTFCYEYFSIGD